MIFFVEFGVYTNTPNFNFGANPQYQLTVQCDDNTGNTPTAVLSVDILAGDKITFSNIPSKCATNGCLSCAPGPVHDLYMSLPVLFQPQPPMRP